MKAGSGILDYCHNLNPWHLNISPSEGSQVRNLLDQLSEILRALEEIIPLEWPPEASPKDLEFLSMAYLLAGRIAQVLAQPKKALQMLQTCLETSGGDLSVLCEDSFDLSSFQEEILLSFAALPPRR